MKYEELLREADRSGIYVIEEATFKSNSDGLINGDVIGINKKIRSNTERACVLAEELGHYHTSVGNILDLSDAKNRKQELRARIWAYNSLIGLYGIISSYKAGCRSLDEIAVHLDVTESFAAEALECYRRKYRYCKRIDNYVIYFEPSLGVLELI